MSAMQRLRVCPCVHANAQGGKRYSEQELASPSGVTTSRFLDRGPHPQPQRLKLWKSESHRHLTHHVYCLCTVCVIAYTKYIYNFCL